MSSYIAFKENEDGSIQVLAGSPNPAVFSAILPDGTEYKIHNGETFTAGGKTWIANTADGYLKAKAEEEKQVAIAQLDSKYNTDKASLSEQYTSAMMADDTELADEIKAELIALNEWYDTDYAKIMEDK